MRATIAVLALIALSGCGGESGGGGGLVDIVPGIPGPSTGGGGETESSAFQVPRAAAATGAVDLATEAATNVLLDTFTDGEASDAPHAFLSPPVFEFTSHVEYEIDLDAEGRSGNDRFPNVSGLLLVTVDGLLAGTWMSGEASYSVMIVTGSAVASVDPESGIETEIPEGASWTYSLGVTWDITDQQNWTVVATETKALDLQGIVVTDGESVTSVSISGGREVTRAIAKVEGEILRERSIEGSFTITIDDGQNVVDVIIEFDADGLIVVTIGDDVFGPFTRAEFREFFEVQFV